MSPILKLRVRKIEGTSACGSSNEIREISAPVRRTNLKVKSGYTTFALPCHLWPAMGKAKEIITGQKGSFRSGLRLKLNLCSGFVKLLWNSEKVFGKTATQCYELID